MKNAIFWKEKFEALRTYFKFYMSRKISYPLLPPDMLQLCFLFRCNLKCKMCNMQEKQETLKQQGLTYELSFDIIKHLIRQAADFKIKELLLVGGEPFLRNDLFDIIKFACSYNIKTSISTNGTLLSNPRIIDKILDSKLHLLSISLDGACENTYENIRGARLFGQIKSNVQLLNKIKKERQLSLPHIIIFCTIMNQNIEELMDVVYLAKELDVLGIDFQPVIVDNTNQRLRDSLNPNWIPESKYGVLDRTMNELIKYKLSNIENFRFIVCSVNRLILTKEYFRGTISNARQKCYFGFNRMIISQDGKIYFCVEGSIKGKVSLGDIYKENLRNIWFSKEARIFRQNIKRCDKPCLLACTRSEHLDMHMEELYYRFFDGHSK